MIIITAGFAEMCAEGKVLMKEINTIRKKYDIRYWTELSWNINSKLHLNASLQGLP